MRACAILRGSIVLFLWMSSARTMPAAISSRIRIQTDPPPQFEGAELASFARRYLLRSGTIRRLTD
jgi:hypothetical protein